MNIGASPSRTHLAGWRLAAVAVIVVLDFGALPHADAHALLAALQHLVQHCPVFTLFPGLVLCGLRAPSLCQKARSAQRNVSASPSAQSCDLLLGERPIPIDDRA
jgi:hypothetical protein